MTEPAAEFSTRAGRDLVELGILAELTGYVRNRRFRYEPYVTFYGYPARDSP